MSHVSCVHEPLPVTVCTQTQMSSVSQLAVDALFFYPLEEKGSSMLA